MSTSTSDMSIRSCLSSHNGQLAWAVSLTLPLLGGVLVFLATEPMVRKWRRKLRRSPLNPPLVVHVIAWVVIYLSMGTACGRVYSRHTSLASPQMVVYIVQCLLNHFYILTLFGLQRIDIALLLLFVLSFSVALCTVLFAAVDTVSSLLMLPALTWTLFCVHLNIYLIRNNPVLSRPFRDSNSTKNACNSEAGVTKFKERAD